MDKLKHLLEKEKLDLLEWLRETYPDAAVDDITDTGSLYWARRNDKCELNCPGLKECPTHGQKIVIRREKGWHTPYEFVVRVGACSNVTAMQEQDRMKKVIENSGIPERYKDCRFGSFITSGCSQCVRDAKLMAEDCAAQGLSLVLMGDPGTGKTHLSIAMAHEYISHGKSAVFISVIALLDSIKAGFEDRTLRIESAVREADFVVIDDLGAQRDNTWVTERLFELIDYRYREKKPMAITSNAMNMNQFADLAGKRGAMIASRMGDKSYGYYAILKDCADFRQNVLIA